MINPDQVILEIGETGKEDKLDEQLHINKLLLEENKRLRSALFKVESEIQKLENIISRLYKMAGE